MKTLKIPPPKDQRGYTRAELDAIIEPQEREKFDKVAGCNTMGYDPDTGETYMYRHDVEKYLAIVRGLREPLHWSEWD